MNGKEYGLELVEELDAIVEKYPQAYRQAVARWLVKLAPIIGEKGDDLRDHIGPSILGAECKRAIWYAFRWARLPQVSGRMVRLFNRGDIEEARLLALLELAGVEVFHADDTGRQFDVTLLPPHVRGSTDGLARGLVEGDAFTLLEFKTHNKRSFVELQNKGLREAKLQHYMQMQLYMHGLNVKTGLYLAACKDDDALYAEMIEVDESTVARGLDVARQCVESTTPPARLHDNPGWYKCRFCDFHAVCHMNAAPHQSCRSCRFSRATSNGWVCVEKQREIKDFYPMEDDNGRFCKDYQACT